MFKKILNEWNQSTLVDYVFISCGRINIIYRLRIRLRDSIRAVILRIQMLNDPDLKQDNGREKYFEEVFNNNAFTHFPKVFYHNDECKVIPYVYSIMEEVNGTEILNNRGKQNYRSLGRTVAKLHNITMKSFGKCPLSRSKESAALYYDNYYENALRLLHKHESKLCGSFEEILNRFYDSNRYESRLPSLIHHDLHAKNIFVDSNNRITLIDWDSSRGGLAELDFVKYGHFHRKHSESGLLSDVLIGYQDERPIEFDANYKVYEMCWLLRMMVFEARFPTNDDFYPKYSYYEKTFRSYLRRGADYFFDGIAFQE